MSRHKKSLAFRAALVTATALTGFAVFAEVAPAPSFEAQFRNPPGSARPRVWWHWMNGNITQDGIAKDMAWMKRVGIGGLQNFDANLTTPQIVPNRLVYMTPEWKAAFKFTAAEAERQGLELTIAASPGWSETGGPWVPPEDGLKKLVWSETIVAGGTPFRGRLAAPPSITGPFQTLLMGASIEELMSGAKPGEEIVRPKHYADVAVIAVPMAANVPLPAAKITVADGKAVGGEALSDADLNSAVDMPPGTARTPASLAFDYGKPQTIRSLSMFLPGSSAMFFGANVNPRLEASDDGRSWRKVADVKATQVPTTISFAPVTAAKFRMVFAPKDNSASASFFSGAPGVDLAALAGGMASLPKPVLLVGELRLSSEPRIDHFEAKAGFELEQDYYALSQGLPDAVGSDPAKTIDLTRMMRADGSLDWTAPRLPGGGRWRVLRLGSSLLGTENHPAPKEATGLEVDKFDAAAVRRYIEHYIGMYSDAAGSDMIGAKGVRGLLTDSIEVGAANWTPQMIAQFKAKRGYDPTPWLPALTGMIIGSRAASDRFLFDYRRTLADLMSEAHYGTVADVAHEHGLKVYGEALEDHRPSLGDDMAMRSHADIPMAAMWTHTREQGPRPSYLADIKGAASVAHLYGQNLVAAESLTSAMSPWAFAPSDLRRIIDLEFVTGVNRPVIHTSVHQPVDDKVPGLSLFIFGQYFNRHETWAEMAGAWVDYMSRNSFMLQQGRYFADVAYFYGEEAPLTGLYGDKKVADAPTRYGYDFVNTDVITNLLSVQDGDLIAKSGARYRVLYLGGSSEKMTVAVLKRLAGLAEAGATIVGMAPTASPSQGDTPAEFNALVGKLWSANMTTRVGKGRVIASRDVEAALTTIGAAPDFRTNAGDGSEILFLHRRLADGDAYMINNRKDRPESFEARFRVTGMQPEIWHADSGLSEAVSYRIENGETVVPLEMAADESYFVVFRKPAGANSLTIPKPVWRDVATLAGPWTVAFQAGRGAPASANFTALADWSKNGLAGIKYFSGTGSYTRSLDVPGAALKSGQSLWLDLGTVGDVAQVYVNGKPAGTVWHTPYRVNLTGLVHSGINALEVRVANLWVNRLIGDRQPGATKITFTASPTYVANAPMRPSGLMGPVRLLSQTR